MIPAACAIPASLLLSALLTQEAPSLRRYGDRGTPELTLAVGYSSRSGFLGGGGFKYFVVDGVAPGVEGTYVSGGDSSLQLGLVLGDLRVVPVRTESIALVLTGRAGRVLLSDHDDGWGAGGGLAFLWSMSGGLWLEAGYDALRLLPHSFCADLSGCWLHGPQLGLLYSR